MKLSLKKFSVRPGALMRLTVIDSPEDLLLKTVGTISRNPEEIVIPSNKFYPEGLSKQSIYNFYDQPNIKKSLLEQFKDKDIFVVIKTDGEIYKRKNENINIRIENDEQFEAFNTGRTVEFHITLGQESNFLFVDLDPGESFSDDELKQIVVEVNDTISHLPDVVRTEVRFSGGRGYHIFGHLSKPIDVDKGRELMKATLQEYIDKSKRTNLSLGITRDPNSMRLDVSTFKRTGSLRALYSLHKDTGLVCVSVKDLKTFDKNQAKIDMIKISNKLRLEKISKFTGGIFVAHSHKALRAGLHTDLRLEWPTGSVEEYQKKREDTPEPTQTKSKNVLRSWVIRKGVPEEPGVKNLAVEVEAHPIEYATFVGEIPKGEYGAGTVDIYDKGTYDLIEATDRKIIVDFHGKKIQGRYNMIKIDKNWIIMKAKEAASKLNLKKKAQDLNEEEKELEGMEVERTLGPVQSVGPEITKKIKTLLYKRAWDNPMKSEEYNPGSNVTGPMPHETPLNPSSLSMTDQKDTYFTPSLISREPEESSGGGETRKDETVADDDPWGQSNMLRPLKRLLVKPMESDTHDFNTGFDTEYTQRQFGKTLEKMKTFSTIGKDKLEIFAKNVIARLKTETKEKRAHNEDFSEEELSFYFADELYNIIEYNKEGIPELDAEDWINLYQIASDLEQLVFAKTTSKIKPFTASLDALKEVIKDITKGVELQPEEINLQDILELEKEESPFESLEEPKIKKERLPFPGEQFDLPKNMPPGIARLKLRRKLAALKKMKKEYIDKLWDGTKVYLVDGAYVRDHFDTDFVWGGHHYAYPDFISKNEIWVEDMQNVDDQKDILAHELFEWFLMKYEKKSYEEAHKHALDFERSLRDITTRPEKKKAGLAIPIRESLDYPHSWNKKKKDKLNLKQAQSVEDIYKLVQGAINKNPKLTFRLSKEDLQDFTQQQVIRILNEVMPKHKPELGKLSTLIYIDTYHQLIYYVTELEKSRTRSGYETYIDPESLKFLTDLQIQGLVNNFRENLDDQNQIIYDAVLEAGGNIQNTTDIVNKRIFPPISPYKVQRKLDEEIRPLAEQLLRGPLSIVSKKKPLKELKEYEEELNKDTKHPVEVFKKMKDGNPKKATFDHITVQTSDVPKEVISYIKEVQKKIKPEQLCKDEDEKSWIKDGKQKLFHITVLYGIKNFTEESLKEIVEKHLPCKIEMDKLEYFEPKDEDYDVLVIRLESKELTALHNEMKENLDNEDSYPTYKPHIAIAYLNKGERIEDVPELPKTNWDVKSVEYTTKAGDIKKVKASWLTKVKKYFSILDEPRSTLDPSIWSLGTENLPFIKPEVKIYIIKNFFDYLERFGGYKDPARWVKNMFYAGSTATYHYHDKSDIDIHIVVDWDDMIKANPDKYNKDQKKMWEALHDTFWWTLNKIKLPGTKHLLTYYVVPPGEEHKILEQKEELYDMGHNVWLVPPGKATNIPEEVLAPAIQQASEIIAKLDQEISDARKEIIDYSLLLQIVNKENASFIYQKLFEKLTTIDNELKKMKETYELLKQKRMDAFDNNQGWSDKNNNYSIGNIVFKLIERYRYMNVLRRIKKITDDLNIQYDQIPEIAETFGLKDIFE